MKKRILSLVLAMVLVALALPTAFAAEAPIPLYGTGSSPEDPLFDPALGLTLTVYSTSGWNEGSHAGWQAVKEWIEARTGLTLNFVYTATDSFIEKMNVMFVSSEKFDAFTDGGLLNARGLQGMYDDGLIIDLSSYIDTYAKNLDKYLGDGWKYCAGSDGSILSIPKRISNHRGYIPTIRRDWLKQAGFDASPATIEEWETYMQYVLDNDMNANGDATDEIPFAPSNFNNLMYSLAGIWLGEDAGGVDTTGNYVDENGVVRRIFDHPNFLAFLDKMSEWYAKGYLYSEFFTYTSAQQQDLITADRIGGASMWYSGVVRPFRTVEEADPTKGYILMKTPKSPLEGVKSCYSEGREYGGVIQVSATSEHPEVPIAYFDWLLSDPDINATVWLGFEGEQWEWADKDNFIFRTLPNASDFYFKDFQAVCQWDAKEQFLYASPEDYVAKKYDEFLKQMYADDMSCAYAADLGCPYTKIGTDLEFMNNDAETLLEESVISYICGNINRDAMAAAIAEYDELYGNVYSAVYTEQYKAWQNK